MTRDPARTQARILSAATREFAAKGFAGARVDAIARRARINKRMLYHYFGDKKALFKATFTKRLLEKRRAWESAPEDLGETLVHYLGVIGGDREWTRLLLWEALGFDERPVVAEEERRESLRESAARVRTAQKKGTIDPDLEPESVVLALIALSMFPWAFPQMVRLVTGGAPADKKFLAGYGTVLARMAEGLEPRARKVR